MLEKRVKLLLEKEDVVSNLDVISAYDLYKMLLFHRTIFRLIINEKIDVIDNLNGCFDCRLDKPTINDLLNFDRKKLDFLTNIIYKANYKDGYSQISFDFIDPSCKLSIRKNLVDDLVIFNSNNMDKEIKNKIIEEESEYFFECLNALNLYSQIFRSNIYGLTFTNKEFLSFKYKEDFFSLDFSFINPNIVDIKLKKDKNFKELEVDDNIEYEILKKISINKSLLPESYLNLIYVYSSYIDEDVKVKRKIFD